MTVNVAGCFLIGLFCALADKGNLLSPEWRILLTTGFRSGFTTFSTFAYYNINLLKSGSLLYFMLYTGASIIPGLLATWPGTVLIKLI
jgi:fluoride exporter